MKGQVSIEYVLVLAIGVALVVFVATTVLGIVSPISTIRAELLAEKARILRMLGA